MLKYFRKYNTWILMIGGVLLMVVFLLPQLPQMMGAGVQNPVIARFTGGEIHLQDRQDAAREIELLSKMQITIAFSQTPFRLPITTLLFQDPDITEREMPELWMLLVAMAERDGLVGGPEDGRNLPGEIARRTVESMGANVGFETSFFDQFRDSIQQELEFDRASLIASGIPQQRLDTLFARARGVLRMYDLYEKSVKLSEPELRQFASRVLDQVGVQWVAVRANRFFNQLPELSPQMFLDHYEKYKNVKPGDGKYGFGYKRYPGYRLEWIEIERLDIEPYIKIDPLEANTFYQQNRDRYPGAWNEAKDAVFAELRNREVDEVLAGIDREIVALLRQSQGKLNKDEDGYFVLPDNWDLLQPSLTMIKSQIESFAQKQYGIPNFDNVPVVRLLGGWKIQDDIEFMPIAFASMRYNGAVRNGYEMAVNVRELYPDSEVKTQDKILYGPAVTVVTEGIQEGTVYYFRVEQTRPAGPPDRLAEVRDTMILDFDRLVLLDGLRQVEDTLIQRYIDVGIDEYAKKLVTDPMKEVVVSREGMEPYQTVDFNTPEIREAIMTHAAQFDPTKPTTSYPLRDRLLIVEMPKALSLAIVEILDVRPLSKELYEKRKLEAESLAHQELRSKILKQWPYTWDRLQETQEFESLDKSDDELDQELEESSVGVPDEEGSESS
jgi:hypothetical protein